MVVSAGEFVRVERLHLIRTLGRQHHAVVHHGEPLATSDLWALGASIAFFLGGFLGLQWQAARRIAPERVVSIVVVAGLCATLGPHIAGAALIASVGIVAATSHTITLRRFTRISASDSD